MLQRGRSYIRTHPLPSALLAVSAVAFILSLLLGNDWFYLASRYGLMAAAIIATVAGIRRRAEPWNELPPEESADARLQFSDEEALAMRTEADVAARRYLTLMGGVLVAATILVVSVYDNFKLWRAIF